MIAWLTENVSRRAAMALLLLLLALLVTPWFANDYVLTVLILIFYFAYTGQAWNIMMGFVGQLSLGHAIYIGLGAYTTAVLFTISGYHVAWVICGNSAGNIVWRNDRVSCISIPCRRGLFCHSHDCVR
jgi:ABC-type branched-subunit amino acid transport system permease subunit